MKDTKIQWHPGFVAAMNLEFMDNREDLEFESEHNLNTKPLEIDLLIIRKNSAAKISNVIGEFFKGHNIIEYKSPRDSLDIDVFYKCGAYAGLYKSYGKKLDERKADDITVTIIRHSKPRELFQSLRQYGYGMSCPSPGIYYIYGKTWFPTQIVVTKELPKKPHTWLRSLSEKLSEEDLCELLGCRGSLKDVSDRKLADSVLEVALEANRKILEEWKGDADMFESLMEIFEPQIQLREEKIRKESMEKGIQGTVVTLRDFGIKDADIKLAIIKNYGLTEAEAGEYLQSISN